MKALDQLIEAKEKLLAAIEQMKSECGDADDPEPETIRLYKIMATHENYLYILSSWEPFCTMTMGCYSLKRAQEIADALNLTLILEKIEAKGYWIDIMQDVLTKEYECRVANDKNQYCLSYHPTRLDAAIEAAEKIGFKIMKGGTND